MTNKILIFFLSFYSFCSMGQTISEIDLDEFEYYKVDSTKRELTGILKSGNAVILNFFKNYTYDQIKILVNNGPDIIEQDQEKIDQFIKYNCSIFFSDKIYQDFLAEYTSVTDYYFDQSEISIGPTLLDNLIKYEEISMGTSILIIYTLQEGGY